MRPGTDISFEVVLLWRGLNIFAARKPQVIWPLYLLGAREGFSQWPHFSDSLVLLAVFNSWSVVPLGNRSFLSRKLVGSVRATLAICGRTKNLRVAGSRGLRNMKLITGVKLWRKTRINWRFLCNYLGRKRHRRFHSASDHKFSPGSDRDFRIEGIKELAINRNIVCRCLISKLLVCCYFLKGY